MNYSSGFCIDHFIINSSLEVSAFVCRNASFEITLKDQTKQSLKSTCRDKDLLDFNKKLPTVYTYCGLFSLIFLIITLFVYMTLPRLKNLHGKIGEKHAIHCSAKFRRF